MTAAFDPASTSATAGTHVARAQQAQGTWAGGTTRAIYAYPFDGAQTSATARFWIGTALIERAAAYSFFPGRQRVHMPIRGHGLRLAFQEPAELVALDTFEQHCFDGARPLHVELVDGPVEAFNLIVATDVIAEAQVLHGVGAGVELALPKLQLDPARAGLAVVRAVYVVAGAVAIGTAGQPVRLDTDDAFVLPPRAAQLAAGDRIAVRLITHAVDVVVATVVFDASA